MNKANEGKKKQTDIELNEQIAKAENVPGRC